MILVSDNTEMKGTDSIKFHSSEIDKTFGCCLKTRTFYSFSCISMVLLLCFVQNDSKVKLQSYLEAH
jgi:hypothetical protein